MEKGEVIVNYGPYSKTERQVLIQVYVFFLHFHIIMLYFYACIWWKRPMRQINWEQSKSQEIKLKTCSQSVVGEKYKYKKYSVSK